MLNGVKLENFKLHIHMYMLMGGRAQSFPEFNEYKILIVSQISYPFYVTVPLNIILSLAVARKRCIITMFTFYTKFRSSISHILLIHTYIHTYIYLYMSYASVCMVYKTMHDSLKMFNYSNQYF